MRNARTALLGGLLLLGCQRPHPAAEPPARVSQTLKEADLITVTLSADAAARLDIPDHMAPLRRARRPRAQLYGGELMAVPGQSVVVVAPSAGTVLGPEGSPLPSSGSEVRAGQPLAALTPLLMPVERVQVAGALADAQGQTARAAVQLETAALALQRAERLRADDSAGDKQVEEARAQHVSAQGAFAAARARRDDLMGSRARSGALSPLRVSSPLTGLVRDVRVALHQQVSAGAPLFEIVRADTLWARVPVLAAELDELDPGAAALLTNLGVDADAKPLLAPWVKQAPQTALAQQGTVDLYFALDNKEQRFRPGQRVALRLARRGAEEVPAVPASAVLYDIHGGAWVYEQTAPLRFTRRRVEVARIDESPSERLAVLSERSLRTGGLRLGARVVTAGAAELFGCEFGVGK